MKYENASPFGVAHYILLIAVTVLCIGVIVYAVWWGMPQKGRPVPSPVQVVATGECAQNIANEVAQMWAYHPEMVPVKYQGMVTEYLEMPVDSTIRGRCNNVAFTCRAGQIRRHCDPCAVGDARDRVMRVLISDMVAEHCK